VSHTATWQIKETMVNKLGHVCNTARELGIARWTPHRRIKAEQPMSDDNEIPPQPEKDDEEASGQTVSASGARTGHISREAVAEHFRYHRTTRPVIFVIVSDSACMPAPSPPCHVLQLVSQVAAVM
jgi:hypothetical protein